MAFFFSVTTITWANIIAMTDVITFIFPENSAYL